MEKTYIEELYPHLFLNNPKSIVASMLRVDEEASKIRAKVRGEPDISDLTIEEKQAIAFQCIENSRKQEKQKQKLDAARNNQRKILREYDPRVAMEDRHNKIQEKRQDRINSANEDRIDQLRKQRQRLVEEISPAEMDKVRQQIKENAQEVKKQDLLYKKKLKEQQDQEKFARDQEILRQEMEKKQKDLQNFNLSKSLKVISQAFRLKIENFKKFGFKKISDYSVNIKTNTLKVTRVTRFRKVLRAFKLWKKIYEKDKLEEEVAAFQAEQERIHYLNQIAQKHYEFWMKRTSLEKLAKYFYLVRRERREAEELRIKNEKLKNYMNYVKARSEEESFRRQVQEKERKELEEIKRTEELRRVAEINEKHRKDFVVRQIDQIVPSPEHRRLDFEEPVFARLTRERNENIFKNKEKLEPSQQINNFVQLTLVLKQDAGTSPDPQTSPDPANPANPPNASNPSNPGTPSIRGPSPDINKKTPKPSKEVLRMQQRQEERKLKREALEAKYREKQEKAEQAKRDQEAKIQEEEKKKKKEVIEKKKLAERTKKEQEENKRLELEDLKLKLEIATDHYSVALSTRVLSKWQEFHYNWQRSLIKAEVFHDRAIKKFGLDLFKASVKLSQLEAANLLAIREERAYNHYLFILKKRMMARWQGMYAERLDEFGKIKQVRNGFLVRLVFAKWVEVMPELMDERYEREKDEVLKVERFRFFVMAPKVMKVWKEFKESRQEERLKEEYAKAMWDKAQEWLAEARD